MRLLEYPDVVHVEREEFIRHRFRYRAGEHATFLGPTNSGKTTLMKELLAEVVHPRLPVVALASKPRDDSMDAMIRDLELHRVKAWPPPGRLHQMFHGKPNGWALWPDHSFDPDVDDVTLEREFRTGMLDSYRRGNRVIAIDEMLDMMDLMLKREMRTLWTRGRSMGVGVFAGTQKPIDVPTYAYDQAAHLFLAYEPDARPRKRFAEIGGVDPRMVESLVLTLEQWQWLYIRRDGRKVCIINP